ncbi:MAG: hypothetical protein EXS14_06220 [Planctomycetes bacterium]|nr:hypothetical protein [Planctomycetota bacterium]
MRSPSLFLVLAFALCTLVPAQSLVSYASPAAQDYGRSLTISPAAPLGGVRGSVGTLPVLAATGFPLGGAAIDQQGRRFFYTNGVQLACMPIPTVQPGIGPFGFLPMPPFFNQITGLAYSKATGCLWITDGWLIGEYNFGAGVFVTGPWPSPYAGTPTRLTGLEFDPTTGNVLAIAENSFLLRFTAAGALLAITPPAYAPPGLATGLALDTSDFVAGGGALYVSYSNVAVRLLGGMIVPLSTVNTQGLAFLDLPADLSQGAVCMPMPMDAWVNSPVYSGNMGFQLTLQGGPIAGVVLLGLDVVFLAAPIVLPSGSNLWLNVASASLITMFLPTNGLGQAFLNAPLVVPPGFTVFAQWAAVCPAGAMLYTSDLLQTRTSMP